MWTPYVYALLGALFAALVTVFSKLGLKGLDSTLVATVRGAIMAGFLIVISLVLQKFNGFSVESFSSKDWGLIVLSAAAGVISWLFFFAALKDAPANAINAIDRLSIAFVVLLAAVFLGEALTWKSILGAILMVAGAIFIVLK